MLKKILLLLPSAPRKHDASNPGLWQKVDTQHGTPFVFSMDGWSDGGQTTVRSRTVKTKIVELFWTRSSRVIGPSPPRISDPSPFPPLQPSFLFTRANPSVSKFRDNRRRKRCGVEGACTSLPWSLWKIRLRGTRRDVELALGVRGTRALNTRWSHCRYRKPRANRIRTWSVSIPRLKELSEPPLFLCFTIRSRLPYSVPGFELSE